jgi:ribonuclease E
MGRNRRKLELAFTHTGTVELRKGDTVLWASDKDTGFKDVISDEFLTAENDGEKVMDYLIDAEVITEPEADDLDLYDEALAAGPDDDDDTDDDDDDDEDFDDDENDDDDDEDE